MADAPTTEEHADVAEEALHAARNKKVMSKLVTRLSDDAKVQRAKAAKLVHDVACIDPSRLEPHVDQLIAALDNPEPQTRWEVLGALEELAASKAKFIDKAVEATTHSLHDEDSSVVRQAAFRVLAIYGASSIRRSEKIWPLLDEALRCYHGDSEYPGMLAALAVFVEGRAPAAVLEEAALLVEPDASHPKATIARGAKRVFAIAVADGRAPRRRRPGGMAPLGEEPPKKDAPAKEAKKAPAKKAPAKKAPKKTPAKGSTKAKGSKVPAKKAAGKKK